MKLSTVFYLAQHRRREANLLLHIYEFVTITEKERL